MSTHITFTQLLAMAPTPLSSGRQMIKILAVTASGGRFRLRVQNGRGEEGEIPLGETGRANTRRLRVLLGSGAPDKDATLAQLQSALVGKHFHVRLTEETYNGFHYLEVKRP